MTNVFQSTPAPTETPFVTYNNGQTVQQFAADSPLATNPTAYSPGVTAGIPVPTDQQGTVTNMAALGVPSSAPGSSTPASGAGGSAGGQTTTGAASTTGGSGGSSGAGGSDGSGGNPYGMTNPYGDPYAANASLASVLAAPSAAADALQQSYGTGAGQGQNQPAQTSASRYGAMQTPTSSSINTDVWVTVPVDKVEVANGKGTVTPTYAAAEGYKSNPDTNAIPPTTKFGRL